MLYLAKTSVCPSIDAFYFIDLIFVDNPYSSEYLARCDERRAFISGFNGSAGKLCLRLYIFAYFLTGNLPGCAIVTEKEAFMFTDGRYFLQAEKQLDESVDLRVSNVASLTYRDQELDSDEARPSGCTNMAGIFGESEISQIPSVHASDMTE